MRIRPGLNIILSLILGWANEKGFKDRECIWDGVSASAAPSGFFLAQVKHRNEHCVDVLLAETETGDAESGIRRIPTRFRQHYVDVLLADKKTGAGASGIRGIPTAGCRVFSEVDEIPPV
ncbi:hypothetical protein C8R44DRAFT_745774 [Mycena epipterygia]|nr:hypothetical protein C8R44DRAFT_745774 [Mycena epipterygia]